MDMFRLVNVTPRRNMIGQSLFYNLEQEPGVIYLHEMTTCLLGIF